MVLFVTSAFGQAADILRGIQPGRAVRVTDDSGRKQTGVWKSTSGSTVVFETKKGEVSLPPSQVRRVEVRSPARRVRNIAIGAGIGVAVGAVTDNTLGVYLRNESSGDGGRALSYALPIAAGAAIGAIPSGWVTIYRLK